VDGFNDDDRRYAMELEARLQTMSDRLTLLEQGQRVSLRRIRRLPDLTATAIVLAVGRSVGKKALLLIGLGIALGAALGGAGAALVQRIVAWALKV
jgi:electron transfer flavoprotein alpha subunit